ncbi:MAG: hypothetical protein AAFV25_17035, partial [Bacteroidota bacterium]
ANHQNKRYMRLSSWLLLCFLPFCLWSQNTGVPLENPAYQILERLEIKSASEPLFHSALKYYARGDVARYAIHLDTTETSLSALDRRDLQYIFNDNNEWLQQSQWPATLAGERQLAPVRQYVDSSQTFYTQSSQPLASQSSSRYVQRQKPIFGLLYKTPANFFELDQEYFHLRVNPILNFRLGRTTNSDGWVFLNQRGVTVRGGVDGRVYFFSRILENQARYPAYVRRFRREYQALPGSGLVKNYKSTVFDIDEGNDFLNAQGYLGFNISKHVGLQLGHGRNFIGHGFRSLLLSDFSNNYFYLKLNTRIWKFHYQNIFAELDAISPNANQDRLIPKKYVAAHYLSFRPNPRWSIGLFEAVVYHRENQFELQYLNPVVLYRTIEQGLDSPDNILIGLNMHWDVFRRIRLYGQLVLDEFKFDELLIERRGWWANKLGFQLGGKYIDAFGVDHLDLGAELNVVRPYTFVHKDSSANYTHQSQSLAHPLGANFREWSANIRYQPLPRLLAELRLIRATVGRDPNGENWGSSLLLSYNSREQNFGNEIGQGIETQISLVGLNISYELFHNGYIDLYYQYRREDSAQDDLDENSGYFGLGFRMNIATREMFF